MDSQDLQQTPPPQQTVIVQQAPSNGLGLSGFVTSLVSLIFCGILSPIALLLSLFGLIKRPRGLAIAGSIISGLQLLFIIIVGIAPILATVGLGAAAVGLEAAAQAEQEERFKANRTAIMETLRTTDDYEKIQELQLDYLTITDEEFKKLIKEAKERVPNPNLDPSSSQEE